MWTRRATRSVSAALVRSEETKTNEHHSFVKVGITSFGAVGCVPGSPNCFTAVPSYRDWITENAGIP